MGNQSKNKKNQPPTGEAKKQNPAVDSESEMDDRAEVLQAQRRRPELNMGTWEDLEPAERMGRTPKRPKAGR